MPANPRADALDLITRLFVAAGFLGLLTPGLAQQWPYYGGSAGNQKYSPLDQINKGNVQKLAVAWDYDTGDFSDGSQYPYHSAFEAGAPVPTLR